jgi:hypothetical protein
MELRLFDLIRNKVGDNRRGAFAVTGAPLEATQVRGDDARDEAEREAEI